MESVKYGNLSHFEMLYVLIESSMYLLCFKYKYQRSRNWGETKAGNKKERPTLDKMTERDEMQTDLRCRRMFEEGVEIE